MYDPSFAPNADIAAVIAAVEDMPLLSGHDENAGLPCFKVARHLNKTGFAGPAADHLPQPELVRDSLLWLHELQEKFSISVPSTSVKIHATGFRLWTVVLDGSVLLLIRYASFLTFV